MATTTTKEETLKGLFDTAAGQIKASKASPQAQIAALKVLCSSIEQSGLVATEEICALVAKELMPRLKKAGIIKHDRWFRKYTDAKYKRPQQQNKGQPEGGVALDRDQLAPLEGTTWEKDQAERDTEHNKIYEANTGKKLPLKKSKSRLRVNVDNPADEGRTEECPDCGAKTPNPQNRDEIVCSGCGETFYISTVETEEEKQSTIKCEGCGRELGVDDDDWQIVDANAYCGQCYAKKYPEEKVAEAAVAKGEEKAISKAKVADDSKSIRPFSRVKDLYAWTRIPDIVRCRGPDCHHGKHHHGIFSSHGRHKCTYHGCKCEDFVVDTRKLKGFEKERPKKKKLSLSASLAEHARKNIEEAEKRGEFPPEGTYTIEQINDHITKDGRVKCLKKCTVFTLVKPESIQKHGQMEGLVTTIKQARAQPSKKKNVKSIPETPKQVAAEDKKNGDGGSAAPVVSQVERTQEEGYNAYPGDPSKKLDQLHFSKKKYTIEEICNSPLFTCKNDIADKRLNTNICGNCGSSKLDWMQIVLRPDNAIQYLRDVENVKGRPVKMYVGFFQCNNCHAFNFFEDELKYGNFEKQEDGSYRLTTKQQPPAKLWKGKKDAEEEHPAIESTAIIDLKIQGGVATKSKILDVLMSGPELEDEHPLRPTQMALRMFKDGEADLRKRFMDLKVEKEQLETQLAALSSAQQKQDVLAPANDALTKELAEQRATAAQAYHELDQAREELKAAKAELATRATKEETAKLETLRVQVEEQKAEIEYLREQVAKASITTADKLQSFEVFLPRKNMLELCKEIDRLNWDKKLPGLVFTTDGHFVQKVKAGRTEEQ